MKKYMIKPPRLKAGATIGIVSPSYQIDEDVYKRTTQIFKERGFDIIEGKSVRLTDNLSDLLTIYAHINCE